MKNIFTALFILTTLFTTYSQDTIHVPADYATIQEAIDAANNGDIVLVAEDTYFENINFKGKAITVASHFLIDGDETHIDSTIIDGSMSPDYESVVLFLSGEDTTSILCGFTLTGGKGHEGNYGGGIYCANAGAKIIHNIITGNEARGGAHWLAGGGIFASGDTSQHRIIIEYNEVRYNSVRGWWATGGGIYIYAMNGRICNNFIEQNNSDSVGTDASGGGIHIRACSPFISSNTIIGNVSSMGGGIYLNESSSKIYNNIIADNIWSGIFVENAQPIIINNSIIDNHGDGISQFDNQSIIINSIVWGNTLAQIAVYNGGIDVHYSDVEGGYSGIGNIDVYPEFVDTANRDYHLSDISPCIGAAIDSFEIAGTWYYCPLTDLEGNPRPDPPGSMPDMGAYENPLSVPTDVDDDLLQIPKEYALEQNYPNPFNPNTTIKYQIPEISFVTLKVYDVLGSEVATLVNEEKPAGTFEMTWNAASLPSGVNFYQLRAGNYIETKKMLLLK